jgi:hypothetical protein
MRMMMILHRGREGNSDERESDERERESEEKRKKEKRHGSSLGRSTSQRLDEPYRDVRPVESRRF